MDKLDIFAAAVHENIEESIAKAKKVGTRLPVWNKAGGSSCPLAHFLPLGSQQDYAGQEDLARRVADKFVPGFEMFAATGTKVPHVCVCAVYSRVCVVLVVVLRCSVLVNAKRAEGQAYERMGITQPVRVGR